MAKLELSLELPFAGLTFDQDDTVTLLVGPSEHPLFADSTLISRNSEYFKAAIDKDWPQEQALTIKLANECPDTMTQYLNYSCSNMLPTNEFISETMHTFTEKSGEWYNSLAKLYVLGERLVDLSIRVDIIKEILRLTRLGYWYSDCYHQMRDAANTIYRGTPIDSPARRLMVDLHLTVGITDWLDDSYEPALLLDIAQGFYKIFKDHANQDWIRKIALYQDRYISCNEL